MSRKGNCWDSAPMESFFSTLKQERVYRRKYLSRQEARQDIFQYIEVWSKPKAPPLLPRVLEPGGV
jgi:putative transposase